jgi:nicotinamidase-related amidase
MTGETMLHLKARSRASGAVSEQTLQWDPRQTALVICDMWDRHWCAGATRRVGEMVGRLNDVANALRREGVLIIHCPSDTTMKFYKDTPQRKLAQQAPPVETKIPLTPWVHIDPRREDPLPIDDSDHGCDCEPKCPPAGPWKRQHEAIAIEAGDAITESVEAYYLMRQRGIANLIVSGVHTNMCVLGRPFGIRQMVTQGTNVVLLRDLTDAMYNPRMAPHVSHFDGTRKVIEHIERFWCPSITSVSLIGGEEFRFNGDA